MHEHFYMPKAYTRTHMTTPMADSYISTPQLNRITHLCGTSHHELLHIVVDRYASITLTVQLPVMVVTRLLDLRPLKALNQLCHSLSAFHCSLAALLGLTHSESSLIAAYES